MIAMRLFGERRHAGALAEAKVRVAERTMKTAEAELDVIEIRSNSDLRGRSRGVIVDLKALRDWKTSVDEHSAALCSRCRSRERPRGRVARDRRGGERPSAKERFLVRPERRSRAFKRTRSARPRFGSSGREATGIRTKVEAEQEDVQRSRAVPVERIGARTCEGSRDEFAGGEALHGRFARRDALILPSRAARVGDDTRRSSARLALGRRQIALAADRGPVSGSPSLDLNPTSAMDGGRESGRAMTTGRGGLLFLPQSGHGPGARRAGAPSGWCRRSTAHSTKTGAGAIMGYLDTGKDIQVVLLARRRI